MTDRELLELAAKAINLPGTWVENFGYRFDCEEPYFWNPLSDDGDALRLVINLLLSVWTYEEEVEIGVPGMNRGLRILEPYNGDPYAATRRAIVRAAAEIGRQMK